MAGQLTYNFNTPRGIAGTLFDISPYAIDSRINAETSSDAMLFGMGVVQGDVPGTNINVPATTSTIAEFEGISMASLTTQQTIPGEVKVYPQTTVGVLRWGKAWARVAPGETPAYGDDLFLIISGPNAGMFSTDDTNLAINGKFEGPLGTGNVAPVVLFNQKQA